MHEEVKLRQTLQEVLCQRVDIFHQCHIAGDELVSGVLCIRGQKGNDGLCGSAVTTAYGDKVSATVEVSGDGFGNGFANSGGRACDEGGVVGMYEGV